MNINEKEMLNALGNKTINRQVFLNCMPGCQHQRTHREKSRQDRKDESNPSIPSVLFPFLISQSHLSEKLPLCFLLPRQVENRYYYHPPY